MYISLENLCVKYFFPSTRPHGVVTWLVRILSSKHLRSFESSPLGVRTLRGVTILVCVTELFYYRVTQEDTWLE